MINLEVSKEDFLLLKMLLVKEEAQTRIEIHHARRSFDYRDYLKNREKDIHDLLQKMQKLMPEES